MTVQQMEEKFEKAFAPEQTSALVQVLDSIRKAELQRADDTRELKHGLVRVEAAVEKLADAQQASEGRLTRVESAVERLTEAHQASEGRLTRVESAVERLTETQQRTEQQMSELTKAQQRTEQKMSELADAQQRTEQQMSEFTKAQQRTEKQMSKLADAQERTEKVMANLGQMVGSLVNTFGFNFEEFVAALLPPYLKRHFGVADLTLDRRYFDLGEGYPEEVDLAGEGQRDGQPITVLVECHSTIGGSETRRLDDKLGAIATSLAPRQAARVIVAMNVHPTAEQAAQETGVWLIPYSRINRERE